MVRLFIYQLKQTVDRMNYCQRFIQLSCVRTCVRKLAFAVTVVKWIF